MPIIKYLKDNKIPFDVEVPLAKVTGMSVQGSLPILAKPANIEQLSALFRRILALNVSFEVIGGLTNTYLCSGFKREIVIQTTNVNDYIQEKNVIMVGCGYGLTKISKELSLQGITGYEGFVGIPGTIGAAAINNSGAFSSVMSNVVKSVTIITKDGRELTLSNKELQYSIRSSKLKKRDFGVLLSVTLDTTHHNEVETIKKKIEDYSIIRKKQIDGKRKSLGSIVAGNTISNIWNENKLAYILRKVMYVPFKNTRFRKKAQCVSEFVALGGFRFIKHCDNIGRFCWTYDTTESEFFDYLEFLKRKSKNTISFEIEIKR